MGGLTFAPAGTLDGVQGPQHCSPHTSPMVCSPSQDCLALLDGGKATNRTESWLGLWEDHSFWAPNVTPQSRSGQQSQLSELPKSSRSQDLITGLGFGCFEESLLFGCFFYWGSRLRCCYELEGGPPPQQPRAQNVTLPQGARPPKLSRPPGRNWWRGGAHR